MGKKFQVFIMIFASAYLIMGCKTIQTSDLLSYESINNKIPALNTCLEFDATEIQSIANEEADLSLIFNNDFTNNVFVNQIYKIGSVECKILEIRKSGYQSGWTVINCMTGFIPSLFGAPLQGREAKISVEITFLNKKNEPIASYQDSGRAVILNKLSGFRPDCLDKIVTSYAMIDVLNKIKIKIDNDGRLINANLSKALSKSEKKKYELSLIAYKQYNDSITKDLALKDSIRSTKAFEFYELGNQKLNVSDYNGAIMDYSNSISLNSQSEDAFNNRGVAYMSLTDYGKAIKDFKTCLKLNPSSKRAKENMDLASSKKTERTLLIISTIANGLAGVANGVSALNGGGVSASSVTPNNSRQTNSTGHIQKVICSSCNGAKVDKYPSYGAGFGLDRHSDKRCEICGKFENHYHKACIACKGTGYIDKFVP